MVNSTASTIPEDQVVALAMKITGKFESCQLHEYTCPAGKPTIGWGKVIKHGQYPNGITREQADEWFKQDMTAFAKRVIQASASRHATVNQLAALTSFAYNCGVEAPKGLLGSHLWKFFMSGATDTAAACFASWCHIDSKVCDGLLRRRLCERLIFLGRCIADLDRLHWLEGVAK